MTRTRRSPRELSESWDDVADSFVDERKHDGEEEEQEEDETEVEYRPRTNGAKRTVAESRESPRRRTLRSSVEPELVMPLSPDADRAKMSSRQRTSTPHMRLSERSLTSDAGEIRRQTRSSTPRTRMLDRSMTGDAGLHRASKLSKQHGADDDESAGKSGGNLTNLLWSTVLRPILAYFASVVGLAMQNMKPIFAGALLLYVLVGTMVFAYGFLNNSINNALMPICRLPFTSGLSFCPAGKVGELQGNVEFEQLVHVQDAFQDVLAGGSNGAELPLDMKRSEASIRDLKHVVQYSSLPSRNELVFEFEGFIATARQASQDLSRFNSRIGRAVDHILSTNRWTLSVIDGVEASEASRGSIASWVGDNLDVFAYFRPPVLSRNVLLDQYLRHTAAVEEQIAHLIEEALALRDVLENLDGRLDVIAGVVTRDGIRVETHKDELFATLWTKLGGNRASVAKLNAQLQLLNDVSRYRRAAWGHVSTTLLQLQDIQHSLEDLRERVALPETVGTRAIPLELHIEALNLGIERLERQRDASRSVEAEKYARIMAKADAGEARMIGSSQKEL